jgi:hypothetical protein
VSVQAQASAVINSNLERSDQEREGLLIEHKRLPVPSAPRACPRNRCDANRILMEPEAAACTHQRPRWWCALGSGLAAPSAAWQRGALRSGCVTPRWQHDPPSGDSPASLSPRRVGVVIEGHAVCAVLACFHHGAISLLRMLARLALGTIRVDVRRGRGDGKI